MLFNSVGFILMFLPITFLGMYLLSRHSQNLAALWLGLASVCFYAVWDARFVLLLLVSISINYSAGYFIGKRRAEKDRHHARLALVMALVINMALLAYFKYFNFFIQSISAAFGVEITGLDIILPLGISFFTFTQIAFLVDVYKGLAREYSFVNYLLFVTWFPHLIAGPVIHHKQMMPQFSDSGTWKLSTVNLSAGLTIFIIGLAKKILIADDLASFASPVFSSAAEGQAIQFFDAWSGALAYSLQLYFDFSAYSDMAIGLSLMFNVRLPANFDSPYKSTSIIDFWRRWHITLSNFLREYLYIPLGGNRLGKPRRYLNLMITMLLGGLWHGAGWTFIIWGGLHGIYLMLNHGWREAKSRMQWKDGGALASFGSSALTFLVVVIAWVIFRSENMSSAQNILAGMAGLQGISLPEHLPKIFSTTFASLPWLDVSYDGFFHVQKSKPSKVFQHLLIGLLIVWVLPNVRQIMHSAKPVWDDLTVKSKLDSISVSGKSRIYWKPKQTYAFVIGVLFFYCLTSLSQKSEFLYFQF